MDDCNALRWWLHTAGLCYQHRGGWDKGQPTSHIPGDVGKWETSHCSPEIQRDSVHYSQIPTSRGLTHNCELVTSQNRTPKILSVMLDIFFIFVPHSRDCVKRAPRSLIIMKAVSRSSWGFLTETLVGTYEAIVCPILNYAAPTWFTKGSSSHLDKLELVQNKALRIETGYHQKAAVSYFRAETGPSLSVTSSSTPLPPDPRPLRATLHASYHWTLRALWFKGDDVPMSPTLRGCPGRALLFSSQTPPTCPDDWGERPVSGTHQSVLPYQSVCKKTSYFFIVQLPNITLQVFLFSL